MLRHEKGESATRYLPMNTQLPTHSSLRNPESGSDCAAEHGQDVVAMVLFASHVGVFDWPHLR